MLGRSRRTSTRRAIMMRACGQKQHIPIDVLELEASQAVIVVLQRSREGNTTRREFRGKRIRIRRVHVGIPSSPGFTLAVGQRWYPDHLEHDHGPVALDDPEERIVVR